MVLEVSLFDDSVELVPVLVVSVEVIVGLLVV
jgi:hypothetical protein